MANVKNIEAKAAQVEEIKQKIEKASTVVFFDYRGLTVSEATELRSQMRKANVEYVVLKNHIVKRACEAANIDSKIEELLHGPSAFAFGYEDVTVPAKILKTFIDKSKKCELKGGILEGEVADVDTMKAIADLPSREVLIARLLGSMMSPIQGITIALDQISKKLAEGGSAAPAAEVAAPAAEEPAPAAEAAEAPAAEASAPAAE